MRCAAVLSDAAVTRLHMAAFLYRLGVQNAFLNGGNAFGVVQPAVVGTTDNADLVMIAGNAQALRLKPGGGASPNVVGGHAGNGVVAFFDGQTIGGGGRDGSNCWNPITFNFTRDCNNHANQDWATVGGGIANGGNGEASTVGGGSSNVATGDKATVSGGFNNVAGAENALVAGGENNRASGFASRVSGGTSNTASGGHAGVGGGDGNLASGLRSTVSGGYQNEAGAAQAMVGGGFQNHATGNSSAIGGGYQNVATGQESIIPGGSLNLAQGSNAFAAGHRAKSLNKGCFTWADSTDFDIGCTTDDAFVVRAQGGVHFVLGVHFMTGAPIWTCAASFATGWSCTSDRNVKEGFEPVDGEDVLQRLAAMPLYYWSPKGVDGKVRHLGPMAQDFIAAFEIGNNDKMIGMQDADGVALAAIQGLYAKAKQRDMQIEELKAEIAGLRNLKSELAELRRTVEVLMAHSAADRAVALGK